MSKRLKVFTLSKKRWLRGNSENMDKVGDSMLWHPGARVGCCLGLFGEQRCGIPFAAMKYAPSPEDVSAKWFAAWPPGVLRIDTANTGLVSDAMSVNDDAGTTDAEKIRLLRPIFRKWGYRIVVTD